MTTYFAIDLEDPEELVENLEHWPDAEILEDEAGYVRIDQHIIVVDYGTRPGLTRFMLENVWGYEVADSCNELIYE